MILYDLQCSSGHTFEGWFPSGESFEIQQKEGLICCAVCGDQAVSRMATGGKAIILKTEKPKKSRSVKKPAGDLAANVDPVVLMKAVKSYVSKNFKNVGTDFAEQAIKMHEGELKQEPIFGTATHEDAGKLDDKEIDYTLLPDLPDEFEN